MKKKINVIEKQSNWFATIYIVFIGLIPLIFTNNLVDGGLLSRQMALAGLHILLAGSMIFGRFSKKIDFGFIASWPFFLVVLFLTLQVLSYFQALVLSEYWQTISKYSLGISYLTLTTALLRSGYLKKEQLFIGISILSAIAIAIAIFQLGNWDPNTNFRDNIYEIKSNFGNKNLFSSVLFFGIFANISLFIAGKYKRVSIYLLIISLAILLIIQTRIVLLALFVSMVIYMVLAKQQLKIKSNFLKWGIPSLVVMVAVIAFSNQNYLENLTDSRSYTERLQVWSNSVEMMKENPITGIGAGNWQFYFPKYGIGNFENPSVANALTTFQRPHNDFLWVGSESGIPGLLIYISLFLSLIVVCYQELRKQQNVKMQALLIAFLIGYMLIAFADFPLERLEHQILLYSLMAIPLSALKPFKRINLWIPALAVLLISAISIPFIYNRIEGEVNTKKLYALQKKGQWQAMLAKTEKAQNSSYQIDAKSIPIDYYAGIAAYSLGDIQTAKLKFENALKLSPYNIHALNNLGSCMNQLEKQEEALELFNRALTISPRFEEAILNQCVIYYNQKKRVEAFETISKISLNTKNTSYPHYLKTILKEYLNFKYTKYTDPLIQSKIVELLANENNMVAEYLAVRNGKGDKATTQIFRISK